MTYQELLEEFDRRRATSPDSPLDRLKKRFDDNDWAIQSILEKLRDGDKQ
jgi:hypothetical protein